MELQIIQNTDNSLLGRQELQLRIAHDSAATPKRMEVRKEVAKQMKAKAELVIIDHLRNRYGRSETTGYAKVYADMPTLKATETRPILARHGLAGAVAPTAKGGKEKSAVKVKDEEKAPAEVDTETESAKADADKAAEADVKTPSKDAAKAAAEEA
ncbi:MAG: hypothetical protein QGE96_02555 [Candidatus Poseidoniia archaeon]|jgi:ribosomal protein S24E|nr:hypothetical protein [Candidatus Poseidoniia archaeon]MDP7082101.1 hypothetical protein [Candidatus Poseidoniia archaeon]MDP7255843.1 hypothetical protein [Candidatus Poseidoniia archaeon]MDP7474159.1 hypothetical protein [Candidatus Poseidoniia archaeon]MDP7538475.1 hypothetical protein [Candidatus Poseidoniia archaeon]|tara:strand:- start:10715 stop:11182 length:468 start_codon:yes stop_codon:yes gene_type:complete